MSDQAFTRQRRNLIIVSIALILYYITGMQFQQDDLFISIRYEVVAYVAIWVVFFYFWWRFFLFGKEEQRKWKMDFLYALSKNKKYRKLYAQPESESHQGHMVWAPSLHGEGFKRYLSWKEAYLVGIKLEEGEIQYAEASTFSDSINPLTQKWSVGPHTIIPLKWHRYFLPALKANLSAIANKSGTEWALPNFLACFALICGISSLITKLV